MSEKEKKLKMMRKNVLGRYEWNDKQGNMLINDFRQVSSAAEELREANTKIYNMFMSLVKDNIELTEKNIERGKRLGKLKTQEAELRKKEKEKKERNKQKREQKKEAKEHNQLK